MVCCIGTLATRSCEPRQARKGAAAAADSGAGMLLVQCAALTILSMSYQVLARKWRPQQFRDMIGQDHVVKALCNALDNNRLHHAYLFTGMRGVGKTTIARVFAKSLNCEARGVSSEPCGECPTCLDIEAGRFFDLIEVDAASRTKVEETRELLENVPYAPSSGRYKVYLIDEVHMFTTHSFNALLKTLEEPPEHVKFILATTDPQKVPVTVLSRCLQFNLKSMPEEILSDYLAQVLEAEKITSEVAALAHIARASEGSVRDALSLVEQAAALGDGQVNAADVESMLGRLSPERVFDLLDSLAASDTAALLAQVDSLSEYSPDYIQLLAEILSGLHQVALRQSLGESMGSTTFQADRVNTLTKNLLAEDVQLFYQIGVHGRRDMPYAPDQRAALEMTLLRMLAFRPAGVGELESTVTDKLAAATPEKIETTSAPLPGNTPPGETPASAVSGDAVAPEHSVSPARSELQAALHNDNGAALSSDSNPTEDVEPTTPALNQPLQAGPKVSIDWTAQNWSEIVSQLGLAGMPLQLASNSSLASLSNDTLTLSLGDEHEHLNSPRFSDRVREAISTARGVKTRLVVDLVSTELNTPVVQQRKKDENALEQAQEAIRDDPLVKTLLQKVDGKVDEASVKPLDTSG